MYKLHNIYVDFTKHMHGEFQFGSRKNVNKNSIDISPEMYLETFS